MGAGLADVASDFFRRERRRLFFGGDDSVGDSADGVFSA